MTTPTAWLNRNNTIDIALCNDGVAIDHTIITRILLIFDEITIDSVATPTVFDLTNPAKVVFKPGYSASLSIGAFDVGIITYDPSNTLGIFWGTFRIDVRQD